MENNSPDRKGETEALVEAAQDMRSSDRRKNPSRRATDNLRIVRLTRIKQWLFPVDAESYLGLAELGVPLTRIHQNFMPTLGLLNARKRKVRTVYVDFNEEILNPFLDKLGLAWKKKKGRTCHLESSRMVFETTDPALREATKPSLEKLESAIRRFFERWGYVGVFELSEKRGKWKLYVKYKFSNDRMPVIPLKEDSTSLPVVRLKLGFVRLSFTLGAKSVETNVSIAAGTGWTSINTTSCLYSQISDVRPLLRSLMEIANKEPENFDIKAD